MRYARALGDAARSGRDLVCIPIARVDRTNGQAVRRENDGLVCSGAGLADAFRECLKQQGMGAKALNRGQLDPCRQCGCRGVVVLLDAQGRKLRRERDADDVVHARCRQIGQGVGNERAPIAHADSDRPFCPERAAQRVGLRQGDLGERRATADRFVIVTHLGDELW